MLVLARRNPPDHFFELVALGVLQQHADAVERVHSFCVTCINGQGSIACVFNALDPRDDVRLHDQHGSQQVLRFVFSHIVFLLLVGGVAATTLAGFGVAFYFGGAS